MYVRRIMNHLLAHCQAAILASSSRHNVQFGSLLASVRALDLRWCGAPPWMTPQDGSHCCRLLIGSRASKAAEILCRFSSGWSASRSQVQTNFRVLREMQLLFCLISNPSSFLFVALRCYLSGETHMCRQTSSLHSSLAWHMTWGCQ